MSKKKSLNFRNQETKKMKGYITSVQDQQTV
jgi:hypothetical protein